VVRIRMTRMGRTHSPFYRINAIEKRNQRDGRALEELGYYNPIAKGQEKELVLNKERIEYWLSVGAQPSETVRNMFKKNGIKVK